MTANWMAKMFSDMDPEEMRSWMEGMGSMMEQWCGKLNGEEVVSWIEEWLPSMMDWCFACLDAEGREKMLGRCREMLDQIESEGLSQEA